MIILGLGRGRGSKCWNLAAKSVAGCHWGEIARRLTWSFCLLIRCIRCCILDESLDGEAREETLRRNDWSGVVA